MILREMEKLRRPSGAFIAAPSLDYYACWLRDHLYTSFCYYYLGEFQKLREGIWIVFDILQKHRGKIDNIICSPPHNPHDFLHAKYNPDTLEEVTREWGHHQLDAIGLFLHIVADLNFKNIEKVIRNKNDSDIIQLLILYLCAIRYWESRDNGMWEDDWAIHASSIGAVLKGLDYIKWRQIAVVPDSMIASGRETLNKLLPNESESRSVDMAQLSLIWPYNVVESKMANTLLERVETGLVQTHGLNRYWGDSYYRSQNGVSGEWPMGFFWLSIIASQRNKGRKAAYWFDKGTEQMTSDQHIPELYKDGKPNNHQPLAWAHAMALIAKSKLSKLSQREGNQCE